MGTRSLTFLYDAKNEKPFLCMYRQFDGYKEGHGQELATFLAPITLLNGFGDQKAGTHANGMGCLAAQMVTYFKGPHGIGGFYLHSPETTDAGQEYEYHVFPDEVRVIENHFNKPDKTIFSGTWKEFAKWTGAKVGGAKPVYKTLRDALRVERVKVTFRKADNSLREMEATLNFDLIPEDKQPSGGGTGRTGRRDPDLYHVFDLEVGEWRSFREERITDWEVL